MPTPPKPRRFRYGPVQQWFKGNTHIHSVESDGGKHFSELAKMYARAGYDFLFRTDHWVASAVRADKAHYPLLWLDGLELDGVDATGAAYHVVCLGTCRGIAREMGFPSALEAVRSQGALLILAHPFWTGNSMEDALRWRFDGVEIYNHVCHWLNGKSDGERIGSFERKLHSEASFIVPPNWPYAYLEIEDEKGRRAWTNTLYC